MTALSSGGGRRLDRLICCELLDSANSHHRVVITAKYSLGLGLLTHSLGYTQACLNDRH